jgi:hypothetical protein
MPVCPRHDEVGGRHRLLGSLFSAGLMFVAAASEQLLVVDLGLLRPLPQDEGTKLATQVAVQTCVGLLNRDASVAGAAYTLVGDQDPAWLADTDGVCIAGVNYSNPAFGNDPAFVACAQPNARLHAITSRLELLRTCIQARRPDGSRLVSGAIHFNASRDGQQLITPNIITLAAVLDALPLQSNDPLMAELTVVFDAEKEFEGFSAMQATEYMHTHHVNQTSTMAQMNPGLDVHGDNKINPPLTKDLNPGLIDYIVKEKLFNFFMEDQCIAGTAEHRLMERIVNGPPHSTS